MISLKYTVTCNQCLLQVTKEIVFSSVEVMLYNPKVKQLNTPSLPLGWISKQPTKPKEHEKHFCSPECFKLSKEKIV